VKPAINKKFLWLQEYKLNRNHLTWKQMNNNNLPESILLE